MTFKSPLKCPLQSLILLLSGHHALDVAYNHAEDVVFLTDSKSVLNALACHGKYALPVKLYKLENLSYNEYQHTVALAVKKTQMNLHEHASTKKIS